MESITDLEQIKTLLKEHTVKGGLSNNYMLPAAYEQLIAQQNLYVIAQKQNLAVLTQKLHNYQAFFIINDVHSPMSFPEGKIISTELPYKFREETIQPLIEYLTRTGFARHILRSAMSMDRKQELVYETSSPNNLPIQYHICEDFRYVDSIKQMMDDVFDSYTGDIIESATISEYIKSKKIIIATHGEELCGFLHFDIKGKSVWINHIAVNEKYRGNAIATNMVAEYIKVGAENGLKNYALWVKADNLPAIRLYQKFGFSFNNKHSLSMVK